MLNELHLQLLASPAWATYVRDDLIPWVLDGRDLGDHVLELGPGPGLTTDVLRQEVAQLTVLELERALAVNLGVRLASTGVEVLQGDARVMPFPDCRFSAVTCFTMLHHVPSQDGQDQLFRETCRVLRPGGLFVGTDATDSPELREIHVDDTFVPVDVNTLPARFEAAGLVEVQVVDADGRVRFVAFRPT